MDSNVPTSKALLSFSPRWADEKLLESTLAGRRDLVDRLEELARDGAAGPNKHQQLIIGVRGSGKTHVLKVLHNRLWRDEELKKQLLIIYLLEDELGVATFLDFLVRALRAIINWYPDLGTLQSDLEGLYDLPASAQLPRARELLLSVIGTKQTLILMENLGITFDKVRGFGRKGQEALRDLVQQRPQFMIFATSQALTQDISDHDYPFFGFFKITQLAKLTLHQAHAFLVSMASAYGRQTVVDFLQTPQGRGRVEAIFQFTGGNHRLLVTFYEFLSADTVAKISDLFLEALNPLRPFYQEQMRSLSALQQKIVQYLAIERTPRSVKDIARGCLSAPNTISKQLGQLLEKGFVIRIEQGRESYYEMPEALFRICYEADLDQQGAPIRLFIDFLASFYTAKELELRCRGFSLLSKTASLYGDEAKIYQTALSRYGRNGSLKDETVPAFFADMLKQAAYREVIEFGPRFGEDRDASTFTCEAQAYVRLGKLDEAAQSAQKAIDKDPSGIEPRLILAEILARRPDNWEAALTQTAQVCELSPQDARGWLLRSGILAQIGRTDEAIMVAGSGLSSVPGDVGLETQLGSLLIAVDRFAEGLKHLEAVLWCEQSVQVYQLAASALDKLGRPDEAEAMYERALVLDPKDLRSTAWLGMLLGRRHQYVESLKRFDQLTQIAPEWAEGWYLRAVTLEAWSRLDDAEVTYKRALVLDPHSASIVHALGNLLGNRGRYAEALQYGESLTRISPDSPDGWLLSGQALGNLGRFEEAEKYVRRALEIDKTSLQAIKLLGLALHKLNRSADALECFEKLTRLDAGSAESWVLAGLASFSLGRLPDAEAQFRIALTLDASDAYALKSLAAVLGAAGRSSEALAPAQRLLALNPDDEEGLSLLGLVLEGIDRHNEAAAQYRKMLERAPDNAGTWSRLVQALATAGQMEASAKAAEDGIRAASNPALIYNTRGEIRRQTNDFQGGLADYEMAARLDPTMVDPHLNAVTCLIALGWAGETVTRLDAGIHAYRQSSPPNPSGLITCLEENLVALFRYATENALANQLSHLAERLQAAGLLAEFEQGLSLAVFPLLRDHASIELSRFRLIEIALKDALSSHLDTTVILRLLSAGVQHLKGKDSKALLSLAREERELLVKELGITS